MQIIEGYYTTIKHYFRAFFQWIKQVPDWRERNKTDYSVGEIYDYFLRAKNFI